MSVTLTKIPNPFQPEINIVEIRNFVENKSLSHYISDLPLYDTEITFIIAVNGVVINDPYEQIPIKDNDIITACAKTEITAAAAVSSLVAGAAVGGSIAFGTAIAYAAVYGATFLATMFVIGYGMSAIASALAPDMPTYGGGADTIVDPTYGWGELRQTSTEGTRIPLLFGANRVAGQVINQFVTISGNKEVFNSLLGICGHEIDSISDVYINNQPYTYFKDVEVIADRLGTNSDTVISGFDEIISQVDVGSKLNESSAVTQDTGGTSVEKLIIFITAPNGLYYTNDAGGLSTRSAIFTVEYQIKDDASWTDHPSSPFTMSGATTETQREIIEIDSLTPEQYTVRITRTNSAEASYRGNSDIYFTALQEVIKESLIYPGLAKYAVKALATDQLSGGTPSLSCLATRGSVSVFDYELGTPAWANKRATNPAWICYSLLVWDANIDKDRLIWDDFNDWADYCDATVDSTYRHIVNTVITSGNFWEQIQRVARMGHGAIIRRGTKYGVFIDKEDSTISHLFTMGNILEETFSMQYLPQKDRANAVEIDYTDVDREYTRQVISVYSDAYLADTTTSQKTHVQIQAGISKAEAIREGVFIVNSNKYLVRVITFDASIDSFACTVGDLFYFQHETVDYEASRVGSRIIDAGNDDGSGNPYIELDQSVLLATGTTYKTTVRLSDDVLIEKTIDVALNGYTNFLDYSEEQDNAAWIKFALSVTTDTTTAPDHTLTADKLIPNTSVVLHKNHNVVTTAAGDVNFSIFVKAAEYGDDIGIALYNSTNSIFGYAEANLTNGTISGTNSAIEYTGSGWYRISVSGTSTIIESSYIIYPRTIAVAGDDSSGIYAWGAQVTEGLTLKDYIKTDSTAVAATSKMSILTSWSTVPEKYDVFLFGVATTYKKTYRLISIDKADDFTRTITGLEYISEIYTENSSYVIEVPTWTTRKQKALQVSLHEFLSYEDDGSFKSIINVSWHRAYTQTGANWSVWLEDTTAITEPVNIGTAYENSFLIDTGLVLGNSYTVYVVSLDEGATDTGDNTATITILGKQAPPDDIINFNGTWDSIKRQVLFTWTANTNLDLSHYEIRSGGTWAGGTIVAEPVTNYTSIFIDEGVSESIAYRIKAVDTSGIESTTEDVDTVAIDTADCPLATPTGLDWTSSSTIVSDGKDAVLLLAAWTDSSGDSDDWHHYDLQLEDMTVNKLSQFSTQNNHFQIEVMPNHSYGITVRSTDFSGNHTAWTTQVVHTTTKDASAPAIPTWPASDYIIPGFKVIGLNWNTNTEYDLSHYILERSTVSDFSSAVTVLGNVGASFKSDSQDLAVSTTYYYRLKAVDTSQNESGYSTIVSETTLQIGQTDIAVDSIIANHINVANLAAINADIGTITAGRIQNAGNTTYLDLSNDLMALGSGLTWDGVNLAIVGTLTIGSGSSGYSNLSGIPASLADINATEGTKFTGIADGADVTSAQQGFLTLSPSDNLVPNPDFELYLDGYVQFDTETDLADDSNATSLIASAKNNGGRVFRGTNILNFESKKYIPVDTDKKYYGEVLLRPKAINSVDSENRIYIGIRCYDHDKVYLGNKYFILNNEYFYSASSTFLPYTDQMSGEGSSTNEFTIGTRYVRFMGLLNYQCTENDTSRTEIGFCRFAEMDSGADVTADNAQPASWITDVGDLATRDTVNATYIDNGSIITDKIDALAVTAAKIAALTITANQIAANTITADEIAANTLTASEIASNAITTDELAANAITAAKGQITNLAVTNIKIETSALLNGTKIAIVSSGSVSIAAGALHGITHSLGRIPSVAVGTRYSSTDRCFLYEVTTTTFSIRNSGSGAETALYSYM